MIMGAAYTNSSIHQSYYQNGSNNLSSTIFTKPPFPSEPVTGQYLPGLTSPGPVQVAPPPPGPPGHWPWPTGNQEHWKLR